MADLDEVLEELIASCSCPACCRYRMSLLSRMSWWAAKLEESIGKGKQK